MLPALEPAAWARSSRSTSTRSTRRRVLWGVNPFDQFGVELGKAIAGRILPAVARPSRRAAPGDAPPAGRRPQGRAGRHRALTRRRPPWPPRISSASSSRCASRWRSTDPKGVGRIRQRRLRASSPATRTAAPAGIALASLFHKEDAKRVQQNVARIAEGKTASAILDAARGRAANAGCSSRCSRRSTRATSPRASWRCCTTSPGSARPRARSTSPSARLHGAGGGLAQRGAHRERARARWSS